MRVGWGGESSHGRAYAQTGRQRRAWGRDTVLRDTVLRVAVLRHMKGKSGGEGDPREEPFHSGGNDPHSVGF